MARRASAVLALAALVAGCGGSGSSPATTSAPAPAGGATTATRCTPRGGLTLIVRGLDCAAAQRVAGAMGPSSARPRFTVRGFACTHPPARPVRCTRGGESFTLAGGD